MISTIREAESAITQAMIDGSLPNPRLQTALRQLDEGRLCVPLTVVRQALAHKEACCVSDGLCAVLCDLHVRQRIPVADLQLLAIGLYRLIWRLVTRLDGTPSLSDLRRLDSIQAARACYGFTFGSRLWPLPFPAAWCARMQARMRGFMHAEGIDQQWREHRPVPLTSPLVIPSDPQLGSAANAIRNTFMAEVFSTALCTDEPSLPGDVLVADVLLAADRHPERIGFLRHLERPQARFRLRQLALVTVALHYQAAASDPAVSGRVVSESVIACLLSPFISLRSWLRSNGRRLCIPLVRETAAGDALIVAPAATTSIASRIPRHVPCADEVTVAPTVIGDCVAFLRNTPAQRYGQAH